MFDNADYVAAAQADPFLKEISMDADRDTGHVEAPTGWVAWVMVSSVDIARWVSREGDPWMSVTRNFAPGLYLVQIDNNGLVWGHHYGTTEKAEADFAVIEDEYAAWDNEEA